MNETEPTKPTLVTSERLTPKGLAACWTLAVAVLGSGGAATFAEKPGAAAAAMIALGGLLTIVALMGRIPLRLEVAGATLDASYPTHDQAYEAGHDGGVREGIETAVKEVRALEESVDDAQIDSTLRLLAETLRSLEPTPPAHIRVKVPRFDPREIVSSDPPTLPLGWAGPSACNASAITYRQLDYWARTGLIEPTGVSANDPSQRLYTFEDIATLALIRRLLDVGVSLQQIRRLVSEVRAHTGTWGGITIVSDGESVYEVKTPSELSDLMSSGRAHFAISLTAIREELRGILMQLPGEPLST